MAEYSYLSRHDDLLFGLQIVETREDCHKRLIRSVLISFEIGRALGEQLRLKKV